MRRLQAKVMSAGILSLSIVHFPLIFCDIFFKGDRGLPSALRACYPLYFGFAYPQFFSFFHPPPLQNKELKFIVRKRFCNKWMMLVNTKLWRKAQIEKWPKKKRGRFRKTCCPKSQEPVLHKRVTLMLLALCSASVAVIGILLSVREGACMKMPKTPAKRERERENWGRIFKENTLRVLILHLWEQRYWRATERVDPEQRRRTSNHLAPVDLKNGFQISNFQKIYFTFQIFQKWISNFNLKT